MSFSTIQPLDMSVLQLFNGHHTLVQDSLALFLTHGLTWIPLYIALLWLTIRNCDTVSQICLIVMGALLAAALAGGMDELLIKPIVARPRPSLDPLLMDEINVVNGYRERGFSFFSAHAANTMAISTFMVWSVRSKWLMITLAIWVVINCWTRLYLGVHYPSDILMGLLWGAMAGSVAHWTMARWNSTRQTAPPCHSARYTATGFRTSDIHVVTSVFVAILTVALIIAVGSLQT